MDFNANTEPIIYIQGTWISYQCTPCWVGASPRHEAFWGCGWNLLIYWVSSREQLTRDGPSAYGLEWRVTFPRRI